MSTPTLGMPDYVSTAGTALALDPSATVPQLAPLAAALAAATPNATVNTIAKRDSNGDIAFQDVTSQNLKIHAPLLGGDFLFLSSDDTYIYLFNGIVGLKVNDQSFNWGVTNNYLGSTLNMYDGSGAGGGAINLEGGAINLQGGSITVPVTSAVSSAIASGTISPGDQSADILLLSGGIIDTLHFTNNSDGTYTIIGPSASPTIVTASSNLAALKMYFMASGVSDYRQNYTFSDGGEWLIVTANSPGAISNFSWGWSFTGTSGNISGGVTAGSIVTNTPGVTGTLSVNNGQLVINGGLVSSVNIVNGMIISSSN